MGFGARLLSVAVHTSAGRLTTYPRQSSKTILNWNTARKPSAHQCEKQYSQVNK